MDNYNNLRNNLASANFSFKPPPVLDDQINYTAEALKGGVEGLGTQLTGSALLSSLKGLRKSQKKVLDNAGIKDADLDDIEASASNGDLTGVASNATKAIIGGINRSLGQGVSNVKASLRALGSRAKGVAKQATTGSEDTLIDTEQAFKEATEFKPPEGTSNPFSFDDFDPQQLTGLRGGLRGDSTIARAIGDRPTQGGGDADIRPAPADPAEPINPAKAEPISGTEGAGDAERLGNDALDNTAKIVSKGEKITSDLKKVDAGMTATDFDPADVLVQGVLGLATIGLGLFIRPHHVKNVAPPPVQATNFSAQLY